jgi:hypothetical protein
MALDKQTAFQLDRFATAFRDARERGANESDTVMYLVKFFEEVFGYDSLKGEISKELSIKDRYCDIALKIDGEVKLLVEAKAAGLKGLTEKHIEQAENYASRAGLTWVLLTNGIEWRLYHLTFNEGEGIAHEIAFEVNLLEGDREASWERLSLLSRSAMKRDEVEEYWSQKKVLSPSSVVRVLLDENVLAVVRRELNRYAPARLEMKDVFGAVRDVLSKEALADAGDLGPPKKRRRRRKVQRVVTVSSTGETVTEDVEVESDDPNEDADTDGAVTPAAGSSSGPTGVTRS